mmetsp:Transcript_27877/g.68545  ORF Transcript_27877/g.68545 Transcript_27877/m.68545 type:complete len:257 (+) Transcript_27877:484-1254(+)
MSMDSTYSFSASGCRHTLTMVPTRISSRDTSTGASAAGSFFFATGAAAAPPFPPAAPVPLPPAAPLCSPPPAAEASPSTSCLANRMSPTLTVVPGARFAPRCSFQRGMAGVPSFWKMASVASGMKGAKKCAATYTASRVERMITALRSAAPSPFTAHGADSVRYLLVSFMALMASSHARCTSKPFIAPSVCTRSAATLKTSSGAQAGTTPSQFLLHRLVARCTRLPITSARSELCTYTMLDSEKGMSLPYTPLRIR